MLLIFLFSGGAFKVSCMEVSPMIVITSIFVVEANQREPMTFEHLEKARANADDPEDETRELIGLFEGKNRVLPME